MSNELVLVIGNKRWSSWSLRPWLALKQAGVAFREVLVPLRTAEAVELKKTWCPSGTVPVLHHGGIATWESLAICEYVAETFPEARLWPSDRGARALARAVSSEMHAGFRDLRMNMSMNVARSWPGVGHTPEVDRDIARILAIWTECRHAHGSGGPFLFGSFSIADAMFAPVAFRFQTYAVPLEGAARAYCDALLALPAMKEWQEAGKAEPWRIPVYEREAE